MKTSRYFIIGIILFVAAGLMPPIYRMIFGAGKDSEWSEIILLLLTAVMVIVSVALIIAGVLRFNSERSANDSLRIDPTE